MKQTGYFKYRTTRMQNIVSSSKTTFTLTKEELKRIFDEVYSSLFLMFGTNTIIRFISNSRGNDTYSGSYDSPWKTLNRVVSFRNSNSQARIILLEVKEDSDNDVIGFSSNLHDFSRIYIIGGRWDGYYNCHSSAKMNISSEDTNMDRFPDYSINGISALINCYLYQPSIDFVGSSSRLSLLFNMFDIEYSEISMFTEGGNPSIDNLKMYRTIIRRYRAVI